MRKRLDDGFVSTYQRIIAVFSAVIMLSVTFQAMANVEAAETNPGLLNHNTETYQAPLGNATIDGANDSDLDDNVIVFEDTYLQTNGSTEQYGLATNFKVSSPYETHPVTQLVRKNGQLQYWTSYGLFSFNESSPETASLTSLSGTILVTNSTFTIATPDPMLSPMESRIVIANDDLLRVRYYLSNGTWPGAVADLEVTYDFMGGKAPKITAEVLDIADDVKDWSVVWTFLPNQKAIASSANEEISSFSLSLLADEVDWDRLTDVTAISFDVLSDELKADWSDAKKGSPRVVRETDKEGNSEYSLKVKFLAGERIIDPTYFCSSNYSDPTDISCQRKTFWYDSYYWAFYLNGGAISYARSLDGLNWTCDYRLSATFPASGSGFDVSCRNGYVLVGWVDATYYVNVVLGTLQTGTITWSSTTRFSGNIAIQPVSVAIGYDNSLWLSYIIGSGLTYNIIVKKAFPGQSFVQVLNDQAFAVPGSTNNYWTVFLPFVGGNLALLETVRTYNGATNGIRYRYMLGTAGGGWYPSNPDFETIDIGMSPGSSPSYKSKVFSAAVSPNGTIFIAYNYTFGSLKYLRVCYIYPGYPGGNHGYYEFTSSGSAVTYPEISIDANNCLHVFYVNCSTQYQIRHYQRPIDTPTSQFVGSTFFMAKSGNTIKGLTTWINPVGVSTLLWTEENATTRSVVFASLPLPYGTPGAAADAWNRPGLSPYGTYFSSNGVSVAPGAGSLSIVANQISISGRGGIDLDLSLVYQQPKYFLKSDGSAYDCEPWKYCKVGKYWSLSLPHFDDWFTYIYLGNGERYVIQWGNQGNVSQFVNQAGTHFILRDVKQGNNLYYELILTSGLRYNFNRTTGRLVMISDLTNYNPAGTSYSEPLNHLDLVYNPSTTYLASITDSALGRSISFHYDTAGYLDMITRPDGKTIGIGYTGSAYFGPTSIVDEKTRTTNYDYMASTGGLIGNITYPTGGKVAFSYIEDRTPSTEARSWLVTAETVKDPTLQIRKTTFDYKILNGRITFAKLINLNETSVIQGSTEYVFQSSFGQLTVYQRNAAGQQMSAVCTKYDAIGQPVQFDRLLGNSSAVNSTEYASYDDWGNLIFKQDALGHDSYVCYANTSTQNSFQGGDTLKRTTAGKILYDAFDDWEYSDWSMWANNQNTIQLDAAVDPPRAPAVRINRANGNGDAFAKHDITMQTNNFYLQVSFMTSSDNPSYIWALAQGAGRTNFRSYNGWFQFRDYVGGWNNVAPRALNTWYDIGYYIKYGSGYFDGTYDIYINGTLVTSSAPFYNVWSGTYIDNVRVVAGETRDPATTTWFDNIRVYKSQSITITGVDSNYVAELYSSNGTLVDRNKTGALVFTMKSFAQPYGYFKLWRKGNYTITTPMMELAGGDVLALNLGASKSNAGKTSMGYGFSLGNSNDDNGWPSGATIYDYVAGGASDVTWISDSNDTVSGNSYHKSAYVPATSFTPTHYHGFKKTSQACMSVSASSVMIQYIWLEEGKIPLEIMLQYYINNAWKRVYFGGNLIGDSAPAPDTSHPEGPVPQTTGRWLQLAFPASDLGISSESNIYGIIYGLYGGTARWDFASSSNKYVNVTGLSAGMSVKMKLDNGTVVSATASSNYAHLYDRNVNIFPVSATFWIYDGAGALKYVSPKVQEVYIRDYFTYRSPDFYVNAVKMGMHALPVGTLEYQDLARTPSKAQESYFKYDTEGNMVEAKAKNGTGWIYSRNGFDQYRNLLWSSDPTGRMIVYDYSSLNGWTYPNSASASDRVDFFDFDTSWAVSETPERTWMSSGYWTGWNFSPSKSIRYFFNLPTEDENCLASLRKEFTTNMVQKITTRFYVDDYSHSKNTGEYMDSGIKMRLYNPSGTNYATYSYWLTCWDTEDNRSAPDAYTKVVFGKPTMDTWLNVSLYPNTDFTIDWSTCEKVAFELYTNVYMVKGDKLRIYFDDFTFNDLTKEKTAYTYDAKNGRVLTVTDALGHATSYWYDEIGRVRQVNNTVDGTCKRAIYNDSANTVTQYDELNRKSITYFDKIGRTTKVERYGTWATLYSTNKQTYNWQDNVATSTDARNRVTTYTYDYLGRVTSVKNNDSSISYITYDDRNKLVTTLDELGHKTVSVLDDLGRLNQTREYITSSTFYTTKMSYNAVGQLLTVRQDNGEVTRMYYDSLGRQTSITYPDSKSESYTYDEADRVLTTTSRSGQVTRNIYDTAGNNIRVIGTSDTIRTKYNADGLVSEKINALGNISYHYNTRDLLYRLVQKVTPNSYTFTYTYNAAGEVIYVDYPDSKRVTYLYDRLGRAADVKMGNTLLLNMTYNADDSVSVKKYCNSNSSLSYFYNTRGFVSKIRGVNVTSGGVFLNLNYNYTKDGNVWYINDTVAEGAGVEQYWYDSLGRLTKAMANSTFSTIMYGYSSVGNRVWKNEGTNKTYTYTTYNKLTTDGTYSYAYDSDGNVIWKNSSSVRYNYIYDSFGQMTEVKRQTYSGGWTPLTTIAKYYYDANGARAKTDEGGTIFRYVYSGHDPIYYNGSDAKGYKDIYLGGRQELRIVSPSEKFAYVADALGSTRQVLQNGRPGSATFSAVTYKPFGPVVTSTGSDRFTYAGEMLDSPTGLMYLFARYYDPELGRFYALDPELGKVSRPQTVNRYLYCANSPMIHTDPTGRFLNVIFGAIIGAAVSAVFSIVTQAATGNIDWGTVAIEAGIGAVTGALAGATMGASILAANLITKSTTLIGSKALQAGLKWAFGTAVKAAGAYLGGVLSSAAGDVLHNNNINWEKAKSSGTYSMLMFGGSKVLGGLVKNTRLGAPILPEKWQFPNSKYDGYLFDERPVNSPFSPTPSPEGFHSNPTVFSISFDVVKAFGSKQFFGGGWVPAG